MRPGVGQWTAFFGRDGKSPARRGSGLEAIGEQPGRGVPLDRLPFAGSARAMGRPRQPVRVEIGLDRRLSFRAESTTADRAERIPFEFDRGVTQVASLY